MIPHTVSHKSPWLVGVVTAGVLAGALMAVSGGWLSPFAKREVIRALKERYQSDIEIHSLDVALFPYPHAALTMDAKLSQMTTGMKSLLLKALDPLFETRRAGAVIPFHIAGTREHPRVGLDLKR